MGLRYVDVLITVCMHDRVLEALDEAFTVHRFWEAPDRAAFLKVVGPRIRGVATSFSYGAAGAPLFDALPKLEIVASFGVGYEHVDAREAGKRGIIVTNTPDVLTEEVADLAIGLLLATLRQLPQGDRFVREGRWEKGAFPLSPTLRGRKVGIVGLGRIGRAIATRLDGFDVEISYHGRTKQADVSYPYHPTLVSLAEAVDTLIVSTTGGVKTRGLIDASILHALGREGVLVNVSRGSVVDEAALVKALKERIILSAGLDVFESEPHVPEALRAMDNVVLLPHLGSASVHTRQAMAQLTADNLISWFSGEGARTPVPETPVKSA